MERPLAISFLLLIMGSVPPSAPAQNLWPISFDFWGHHPDKLAADIRGAEESIARAQALGRLYDVQIRPAMNQRVANMSLKELSLYNRQTLFAAEYPPDVAEPASEAAPSTSPTRPSSSPSAPASGAPPSSSGSPFPSSTSVPGSSPPAPSNAPSSSPGQTVPAAPFAPGPETTPSSSTPAAPSPTEERAGTDTREPRP